MNTDLTLKLNPAKIDKGLKQMRAPFAMTLFQGAKMPLGLAAGLTLDKIDRDVCEISIPGGWRTQNPFGSMYWAAQGMAAEMATGIHPFILSQAAPFPVQMILGSCQGTFVKMCKGRARFVFNQGALVAEKLEETIASGERLECPTEVIGYDPSGDEVSRWIFTWSLKAKRPKA